MKKQGEVKQITQKNSTKFRKGPVNNMKKQGEVKTITQKNSAESKQGPVIKKRCEASPPDVFIGGPVRRFSE